MTFLTFYGGINEIGGNKFLLEDKDTKIFLDFGMSFKKYGQFYEEFLQPRTLNALGDLIDLGILPDVERIYRDDLLKNEGRKLTKEPIVDGVVFSHAHADHTWHAALLHKDIPFYCTEESKKYMQAVGETGRSTVFSEVYKYKENFVDRRKKPEEIRKFNVFESGKKFKIDGIEILPLAIDHSIYGAVGMIIYASEGVIVYTGDIRLHGINNKLTSKFIAKAAEEKPDLLLVEGTRVKEASHGNSEQQVYESVNSHIANTKELVCCSFPNKDMDRLNTFFNAASKNKRKLAIPAKMMYLLELFNGKNVPKADELALYMDRRSWGRFEEQDYDGWQRKYLKYKNMVTFEDIMKNQNKYVFFCDFFNLNELLDVKPKLGSSYIYSLSEPFNEEMQIDRRRMENWLNHFKLPMFKAHASGHASGSEIKELIQKVNAKKVIPIHTEHAEVFREFGGKVEIVGVEEKLSI